jgi:hypothetical protein
MEAACSSGKSFDFQRTTRRYIPEDITLHIIIRFNPKTFLGPSVNNSTSSVIMTYGQFTYLELDGEFVLSV